MNPRKLTFWNWFIWGCDGRPGFLYLINRWLIFHLLVGALMSFLSDGHFQNSANSVLLPLVGILIGLTFAWAGNSHAIMQTHEIHKLSEYSDVSFEYYVYSYQLAILVLLATVVVWGLAGLGVFGVYREGIVYAKFSMTESLLFSSVSLTIQECWHSVSGASLMLIARKKIKDMKDD